MWRNGSAPSWECWEKGLIPSPAQWIKDQALPQLQLRLQLWLRSDTWLRNSVGHEAAKKEKTKLLEVGVIIVPISQLGKLIHEK